MQCAMETCHVIITTGGVSMGQADIVQNVLVEQLGGTLHFGRMHIKPGKPTTFVTAPYNNNNETKLIFAMPGNPICATICIQLLVQPCIDLLLRMTATITTNNDESHGELLDEMLDRMVENVWVHPEVSVVLVHAFRLDTERPEYHRVALSTTPNKENSAMVATSTGAQPS